MEILANNEQGALAGGTIEQYLYRAEGGNLELLTSKITHHDLVLGIQGQGHEPTQIGVHLREALRAQGLDTRPQDVPDGDGRFLHRHPQQPPQHVQPEQIGNGCAVRQAAALHPVDSPTSGVKSPKSRVQRPRSKVRGQVTPGLERRCQDSRSKLGHQP